MRLVKWLLIFLVCLALVGIGRYSYYMLPVFSAGAAKTTCSCMYVGGRTLESIQEFELAHFPLNLATIHLDKENQTVTASVFGLSARKAIYRKGLGCTLVVGITEEEIREQKIPLPPAMTYDPDTLPWPTGNIIDSTLLRTATSRRVQKAISQAFVEKDPDKPVNTRAVVVVYRGQILAEAYADGYAYDQPQLGWSMTKSLSNALAGILVDRGKLSLTAKGILPEWSNPEDPRYNITLDHLLKMTSGLQWDESYFSWSPVTRMVYTEANMSAFASSLPLEAPPGQEWKYSSGTTNAIFDLIKNTTGRNYHTFPYKELFHKIGMTSTLIELDASGQFVGSTFGWATTRDWARFGLLYLNGGMWEGQQILSNEWIAYSRCPGTQAPDGMYAAHFWRAGFDTPPHIPDDLYFAQGFDGQRLMIIPSKELIIVRLGQTHFENFDWDGFISSILIALD
ncbi:serine hydrolase domain-containing protein [Telluribacter humicola]|uniref:serine hydrolase domain-containing protein n=1 Tax=Telluribacter humicola TaxID=1720261 RepID=UPI001A958BD1|nr:serine hydrolase [Telluribacter humicola]